LRSKYNKPLGGNRHPGSAQQNPGSQDKNDDGLSGALFCTRSRIFAALRPG
jgi:hypothetical protein